MLMRRFGRLPVLFWSQVFAVGWLVGCTFAPNIKIFTGTLRTLGFLLVPVILKLLLLAMRCLNGFFAYVRINLARQ